MSVSAMISTSAALRNWALKAPISTSTTTELSSREVRTILCKLNLSYRLDLQSKGSELEDIILITILCR